MSDGPSPSEIDRFDYFMIRLHRTVSEPDRLSGQVERLGTGERWRFDTGEQLVRLVGGGFALDSSMQLRTGDRNAVQSETTGPLPDDNAQS